MIRESGRMAGRMAWESAGRMVWESGRMAWESAGRMVWDSSGMGWESADRMVWDSSGMGWESAGRMVWESSGMGWESAGRMVWESGSNQVVTVVYTSHSHVQLVYEVSNFMRQRPASLVHHEVAHAEDLSSCISPVQRLLILLVWQNYTVAIVH